MIIGFLMATLETKIRGRNVGIDERMTEVLHSQLRDVPLADRIRPTILTPTKLGRSVGEAVSIPIGSFRVRAMNGIERFHPTVGTNTSLILFSQLPLEAVIKSWGDSGVTYLFSGVNGLIIPQKTTCNIRAEGDLYTFYGALENRSFAPNPIGFRSESIKEYITKYGTSKIMVPLRMNMEHIVLGGIFGEGSSREKEIVLGPHKYDFSAGNSISPQSMHAHDNLYEIFITFSGMRLFYPDNGRIDFIVAKKGEGVIVPPGLAHLTVMDGEEPTFVLKASLNGSVAKDKRVLLSDDNIKEISELLR